MQNHYRIALIQMSCSPNPEDNLGRAIEFVRLAAKDGAEVICLPELFRTQYFCQREDHAFFDLAEPIPGPTSRLLSAVARENKITIVASLFEKRAPGVYHNTAAVVGADGALAGIYRKMHIPDDPLYYEKFYFTPGDLGFRAFKIGASGKAPEAGEQLRIGALVCWDQWYPEAARLTALQGAHVLFYPTAIGWHPAEKERYGAAQLDAWRTIQRAHAIANGVYVAVVNRVGFEAQSAVAGSPSPEANRQKAVSSTESAVSSRSGERRPATAGLQFWGNSFICDPFGQVIAQASDQQEEVLIGEVDLGKLEEIRRHWPFLRDRRIDSYGGICHRFLDSPHETRSQS